MRRWQLIGSIWMSKRWVNSAFFAIKLVGVAVFNRCHKTRGWKPRHPKNKCGIEKINLNIRVVSFQPTAINHLHVFEIFFKWLYHLTSELLIESIRLHGIRSELFYSLNFEM